MKAKMTLVALLATLTLAPVLAFSQLQLKKLSNVHIAQEGIKSLSYGLQKRGQDYWLAYYTRKEKFRAYSFDANGLPTSETRLTWLNDYDDKRRVQPYNFTARAFPVGDRIMTVDGNGATWFDAQGRDVYRCTRPMTCPPVHFLPTGMHFITEYGFDIEAVDQIRHDDGLIFMPVTSYQGSYALPKEERFLRMTYGYAPPYYRSGAALFVVCKADTQGLANRLSARYDPQAPLPFNQIEYKAAIGKVPDLIVQKYVNKRYNNWLRTSLLALDTAANRAFTTQPCDEFIDIYSYSGDSLGRIAKAGFDPKKLSFFRPEPFGWYRGREARTNFWDEFVFNRTGELTYWSAIHYALSETDVQLFHDPQRNWLYRVVQGPGQRVRYEDWEAILRSTGVFWGRVQRLKETRLQIYDLNADGALLAELPVASPFRILEVDAQGDLWAIVGEEETKEGVSSEIARFSFMNGATSLAR